LSTPRHPCWSPFRAGKRKNVTLPENSDVG
jgi:hypothetical protein